ncbi:hypothetical protein [Salibacterium halotolerans]|uniref:Uncharacterized protein n=1 Tax=Salibacterium halotolerans TaxID=1884432 RepID=A0A1I5MR53_9BACI|nr:hypothetical protein [Salibacterium halotolerans]SFP12065.1 hypothetical protein SAMN05518683_102314 [Salibacterium halotolerans]
MNNKPVMIYGYELTTPKFMGGSMDIDRYDNETLEFFLNRIINEVPLSERKLLHDNKMINLTNLQDSNDQEFLEGVFTTARFGKEQKIIDVRHQIEMGEKGKEQGVLNEVNFVIHKNTGLLLVEKDTENVARKGFIQKFFSYHRKQIEKYHNTFNKKFKHRKIYRRGFLKVISLPSKSFFDEIEDFATVKDAFVYKDVDTSKKNNNEAADFFYMYSIAKENGVEDVTRLKMSFENKIQRGTIKHVKKFFETLHESQYYDGLGVSGKLQSGRNKTIQLENIQRIFDIEVSHHDNGLPSLSSLLDGMINLAKKDNPLRHKNKINQFKGVDPSNDKESEEN